MNLMRRSSFSIALLMLGLGLPCPDAEADAEEGAGEAVTDDAGGKLILELQERMGDIKTVQTDFVQEKQLAVFDRKITLRGRIALNQGGWLAWRVLSPVLYSLVVTGNTVQQWDEDSGKVQKQSVSRNPVLKAVTEQLRRWFSGQYDSLRDTYRVEVVSDNPAVLAFSPRSSAPEHKIIDRVQVSFRKDRQYLREIRIEEKSGDWTSLVFTNTVLNAVVDPSTWVIDRGRR